MEIRKFCDDYYDIIKPMVIMIIMIDLLPDHDHDHDHDHNHHRDDMIIVLVLMMRITWSMLTVSVR